MALHHLVQGVAQAAKCQGEGRALRRNSLPCPASARNSPSSRPNAPTVIPKHLAQQQVIGLDLIAALVDHRDATVAQGLLDGELGDVAVTAEDLQGIAGLAEALFSEKRLDDRGQQRRQWVVPIQQVAPPSNR